MGRKAFTLIELLVVIAIIGILAAMLLSALGQSRERARKSYCLGNLRQVGLATQMYGQDTSEMPVINDDSGNVLWDGQNCGHYGFLVQKGYIPATVFFCPSVFNQPPTPFGITGQVCQSTYWFRGPQDGAPTIPQNNSQLSLMADYFQSATQTKNHADGMNVLYSDGSVRWVFAPAGYNIDDFSGTNAFPYLDHQ